MTKEIETIRELLPKEEILLQLAEEANELAVAIFERKKRMKYGSCDCSVNFIEEIADVKVCIDAAGDYLESVKNVIMPYNRADLNDTLINYCNELSKAAIKLRRTMVKTASPTPVSTDEAENKLILMITYVKSCIDLIGNYWDRSDVQRIYKQKVTRWIDRLNSK